MHKKRAMLIIQLILKAFEGTAKWTTDKIAAVRELIEHTAEYICEQPYCRINNLIDRAL